MTKGELIKALRELPTPDSSQVLVCDIQDDNDERFHFEAVTSIDILSVRSKEHTVLVFNEG